jgi:hypothetical protein
MGEHKNENWKWHMEIDETALLKALMLNFKCTFIVCASSCMHYVQKFLFTSTAM